MIIWDVFEDILSGVLNFSNIDCVSYLIFLYVFCDSWSLCCAKIWSDTDGERFSKVSLLFFFKFL